MSPIVRPVVSGKCQDMPCIGLGTWQNTSEEELHAAIDAALEAGYRNFDTAYRYMNEEFIGRAFKKWLDSGKIKREELFITTKLPNYGNNPKYVEEFITKSLSNLQLSYIDLYLIHHPVGIVYGEGNFPRTEDGKLKIDKSTDLIAVWKAMEAQVDAGRAKKIGVSNFNCEQIDRILKVARIPPACNQIEIHLYLQQKKFQAFSKKIGMSLTAYAPLGSPRLTTYLAKSGSPTEDVPDVNPLTEPAVLRLSKTYNKTPAQVLLRHLTQLGIMVIPKSVNPNRIRENYQIFDFELNDAEMAELNALDKGEAGRRFVGSILRGIEDHPEYPFKDL